MSNKKEAEEYIQKIIQACEAHDYRKVLEYANKLESLNPKNELLLKELQAVTGCEYSEAVNSKIIDLYTKLTDKEVADKIREAAYESAAEYFDDVDIWLEFLEEFPGNKDAFYAVRRLSKDNISNTLKAYKLRLSEFANDTKILYSYAEYLSDSKMFDEAIETYQKILDIDPSDADSLNNYANILADQKRNFSKAEEYYKKAIELRPREGLFYYNLAILYEQYRRYDLAKDIYEKVIDKNIRSYLFDINDVYVNFANILNDIYGKTDEAENFYKRVLETDEKNHRAHYGYAHILSNALSNYSDAKKHYLLAIKNKADFFAAYHNLAVLLFEHMDEKEDAKYYFLKAIELNKDSDISRMGLGEASQFEKSTFISELEIKKVRHLRNINIKLDKEKRKHLFFTGKNGSGKTSVLIEAKEYLEKILEMPVDDIFTELGKREFFTSKDDYKLKFNVKTDLLTLRLKYETGNFIVSYFPARRKLTLQALERPAKKTKIPLTARISDRLNQDLIEYYWNLKTQALLALDNGEKEKKEKYDELINSFIEKIKKIDNRIEKVEFTADEGKYNIVFNAKKPYESFDFSTLADGYASVFDFVSEIILRMSNETDDIFNLEGIVLIDEPESHLHIEMQKKVIPLLIEFFPNIQFIVATHSPFVLSSISDAVIYDLETQIRVEDFSEVPVHKINEYFFSFSNEFVRQTEKKVDRYVNLIEEYTVGEMKPDKKTELAELDIELQELAPYISHEYFVKFKENQKKLYD